MFSFSVTQLIQSSFGSLFEICVNCFEKGCEKVLMHLQDKTSAALGEGDDEDQVDSSFT